MAARVFGVLATTASANVIGWPSGEVRHHFHDTEYGQIHYVTSGDLSNTPMVYYHGHPRSSSDFKHVHAEMNGAVPFLGVDWFGFGQSEDFKGSDEDDFATFELFANLTLDIVNKHKIDKFSPVGWLKGCHSAIELANQAGPERLHKVALMGCLILSPEEEAFIVNTLVPYSKNPELKEDGSHLIDTWNDPSGAAPELPADMEWNQDKTNDALRSTFTQWTLQAAWGAYNPKIQETLAHVDSFAKTLVVMPTLAMAQWDATGLPTDFSVNAFDQSMVHGNNKTLHLALTEGGLKQNATLIANTLIDFLTEKHDVVV